MTEPKKAPVADFGPARNNMIHDIIVANTHLIADKLMGVLAYILGNEDEHGLVSIVFTKDMPKNDEMENVLSRLQPDSKSLIVNLDGHYEMAVDVMKESNGHMAVWSYLWMQIIRSIFHELHHAHTFADAEGGIYSVDTNAPDFETRAETWCDEEIIELAKVINIEPPPIDEFPYYREVMLDLLTSITDGDIKEDWAVDQFVMLAESMSYYKPGVDGKSDAIKCVTLRDYFQMLDVGEGGDVADWSKPVQGMAAMAGSATPGSDAFVKAHSVAIEEQVEDVAPVLVATPDLTTSAVAKSVVTQAAVVEPDPEFAAAEMEGMSFDPYEGVAIHDEDGDVAPSAQPLMASNPAGKVMDNIQAQTLAGDATPPVLVQAAPALVAGAAKPIINTRPVSAPTLGGAVVIDIQLPGGAGLPAGSTPTAPMKQLVPHGLTSDEIKDCLQLILVRLYSHIFCKCGWNPGLGGRGFTNPAAVLEAVSLADIPNADKLVHAYEDITNKAVTDVPYQGQVAGLVLVDGQMPGYHLQFNLGGMVEKRSFIPQDMQKTDNNGQLKDWSKKAQAGAMMAMMLDDGGVVVKIATAPGGQCMYEFDPFKRFI